jgi:hypothetical protein
MSVMEMYHGIARVAIQADDDEMGRRSPGSQRAFSRNVEGTHARQQPHRADDEGRQAQRLDQPGVGTGKKPPSRNRKGHYTGQRKERQ